MITSPKFIFRSSYRLTSYLSDPQLQYLNIVHSHLLIN